MAIVIAGCSAPQQQTAGTQPGTNPSAGAGQAKAGGTLVVSSLVDPDSIDVQRSTWVDYANSQIYDSLFTYDTSGKIVPGVAEKYEVSKDGKVWTFTLRKDVKYHSGEPMTAEGVKVSIERFAKISPVKDLIGPLDKVEAPDPQTVKVYLKEPFAPFMTMVTAPFIGPLDPKRVQELGDKFGDNPSATGPFILEKHERGGSVIYKKNPDYKWGPSYMQNTAAPHIDQLVFKFLKDDDTRMLEFKKGTIQIMHDVPTNYVQELQSIPGVEIHKMPETGMKYLGFNNKKPIFQDVRVKQAIAMAVDREPIIQVALAGFAQPVFGPLPSTVLGHSEKVENMAKEKYARNVEKAKALLAEAGWTDSNGDGIVEKDGKPFSVELLVINEPTSQRVAQILQSQLKEIGVDLKLSVNEVATVKDRTSKAAHEMVLLYWGYTDPDILYLMFSEKMSVRLHFSKPEIEALLVKGRQTMDQTERMKIYEQLQEILVNECPWVPLYSAETVIATRDIEGLKVNPFNQGLLFQDVKFKK